MNEAFVLDALRSPIGKYGGTLSTVRPDDLSSEVIKALLKRNTNIETSEIEDVYWGAANQAGEDNRNVARMAALLAGLPTTVAGCTVNRLCASGLEAIMQASRATMLGEGNIYIAGGCESMSRAPFVVPKSNTAFDRNITLYDTTMGWRFINPNLSALYPPFTMGETAENVAKQYNISRQQQDEFAQQSQQKYFAAHKNNTFKNEIIPIPIKDNKGNLSYFETDEHPRITTLEKLAALPAAFIQNGTVTAGNSSGINDGAAALLICNQKTLLKNNLKPIAKIVSMAVAGVNPSIMGVGPVPAVKKALQRAQLKLHQIDIFEINEAFAAQTIACINELNINPAKVNLNGGAIALGHPLGCSGARISTTLIHELSKTPNAKYGLATMCVGLGQGAAIIYEKV